MSKQRPFRFGTVRVLAASKQEWAQKVRRVEEMGYDTLLVWDHFGNQFAPISAMMAAADATERLRVSSYVFDNDYRHPLVLAKELATLDVLSGGRLEIGMGAGWMVSEYNRAGIPFDPPGVRVDRFTEGVQVVKGLLSAEQFSFQGKYYQISDFRARPRPVQQPHPPIMLGGARRRLLQLAAREADIVAFNTAADAQGRFDNNDETAEATHQKLAWVQEAAGERFAELELHITVTDVLISDDRERAASEIAARQGWTIAQTLESPLILVGTVEQMIADLQRRREEYGISYIGVDNEENSEQLAPVVAALRGK